MRNKKNIIIAYEALSENIFRSILTALGIIFGVAAVITMLAIGNGAQKEIVDQIELIGAKNIIITPTNLKESEGNNNLKKRKRKSPGLSMADYNSIKELLPSYEKITPYISLKVNTIANFKEEKNKLTGVNSDFFHIYNLTLDKGKYFTNIQEKNGSSVCVIGSKIAKKFFLGKKPIGSFLRCDGIYLKVIGVISSGETVSKDLMKIGMSSYNNEVFIPVNTILKKYKNIKRVTSLNFSKIKSNNQRKNQLDKIIIGIKTTEQMNLSVTFIENLLFRKHNQINDYEIIVPKEILEQKKKTNETFNILLGLIAAISLLVGGIGIMNIMLASVMERIKEIGLRMAIGAKKKDIKEQFIYEAGLISLVGGIIGIFLGVLLSYLAEWATNTLTIISPISIIISFLVSALVGVIFGYTPAKKAADKDPVHSLRHD